MVHSFMRRLTPAAFFAAACAAVAQTAPPASRPDPLDPHAKVPAYKHVSSFGPARRGTEDKAVSWREANDNVARIGGWRVYAREAQQAEPAAAPASAAAARPMPHHGHGGHKTP